jgi:hypothetical protein
MYRFSQHNKIITMTIAFLVLAACGPKNDAPPATGNSPTTMSISTSMPGTIHPTATATIVIVPVMPDKPIPSPIAVCGNFAPYTRMIIREHGQVSDDDLSPLNLRVAPGTDQRVLEQLQVNDVFMVLDGPQCEGEYVWYYIKHGDLLGWVAEGDMEKYYIKPYLPG